MNPKYRILAPEEVPEGVFDRKTGIVATLRKMAIGDVLSIPATRRGSMSNCAAQAHIRITTRIVDDVCYVKRIEDQP